MPDPEDKQGDEEKKEEGLFPAELIPPKGKLFDNFAAWFEFILIMFLGVGWFIWELYDHGLWVLWDFFR